MIKILIWGTGKNAREFMEHCNLEKISILAFVETEPKSKLYLNINIISPEEIVNFKYDYLIIASTFEKQIMRSIHTNNICENKILFWNNKESKKIIYKNIPLSNRGKKVSAYELSKPLMPYQVCNVDNTYYMYNTSDDCISTIMVKNNKTFSKEDIEFYFKTSGICRKGIFLDIGANIGTTSLYVKKNISKNIDVIAFEPVKENFNMLRINCILNNCEDIKVENIGLSNQNIFNTIGVNRNNYGASKILNNPKLENDEFETQNIECMRLDDYINKNKIEYDEIKYIWIDVEGHEAYVIDGGKDVLSKAKANLFMEYNVDKYIEQNMYESILVNLKKIYSYFICIEKYYMNDKRKRPIEELDLLYDEMEHQQCNVLFIK